MSPSCRVKVFKRYADSGGPHAGRRGDGGLGTKPPRRARSGDLGIRKGTRKKRSDDPHRRMASREVPDNSATRRYPDAMRIDRILASPEPTFSVEFFPPKTPEAAEQLFATAHSLKELQPDFVS